MKPTPAAIARCRRLLQQGYKVGTAARLAGVSREVAQQIKYAPATPKPKAVKPPVIKPEAVRNEAKVDRSEAYFHGVVWAAREALAQKLARQRAAIEAQRH